MTFKPLTKIITVTNESNASVVFAKPYLNEKGDETTFGLEVVVSLVKNVWTRDANWEVTISTGSTGSMSVEWAQAKHEAMTAAIDLAAKLEQDPQWYMDILTEIARDRGVSSWTPSVV